MQPLNVSAHTAKFKCAIAGTLISTGSGVVYMETAHSHGRDEAVGDMHPSG